MTIQREALGWILVTGSVWTACWWLVAPVSCRELDACRLQITDSRSLARSCDVLVKSKKSMDLT